MSQSISAMMFGDVTTVGHRPPRPQPHRAHDEAISQAGFLLALKLALVLSQPRDCLSCCPLERPKGEK